MADKTAVIRAADGTPILVKYDDNGDGTYSLSTSDTPGAGATVGFAFEALSVTGALGGVGFTTATYAPVGQDPAVRAVCGPLETGQIRYTYDGTAPTALNGHLLEIGSPLTLEGAAVIAAFRAIRTGGTSGVLPTTFER